MKFLQVCFNAGQWVAVTDDVLVQLPVVYGPPQSCGPLLSDGNERRGPRGPRRLYDFAGNPLAELAIKVCQIPGIQGTTLIPVWDCVRLEFQFECFSLAPSILLVFFHFR